ncbi:hypothetical protein OFM88_25745, partial [Escherichia coli]|nr:hypothetical protein [Escherichia coli]
LSSQFDPGGEFDAVTDQDIQMDENYNIISCLREGKRIFFVPVSSKSLETNEFLLSGASELINSTMFSPGGEFEAWASYSDIQSDETENLLSFLKGGVRRFLTPVSTPEIDADVVKIS